MHLASSSEHNSHDSIAIAHTVRHIPPKLSSQTLPQHSNASSELAKPTFEESIHQGVEKLQGQASQFLIDPDLSQTKVFRFCAPLLVFIGLILAAILLPRSSAAAGEHALAFIFIGVLGSVVLGLVVLRVAIWGVSAGVRIFVERDWRRKHSRRENPGLFELVARGGLFST